MSPGAAISDVLKRALLGALLALLVVLGTALRPAPALAEGAATDCNHAASTYDAYLDLSTACPDLQGQGPERRRENGSGEGSVAVCDSAYAAEAGAEGAQGAARSTNLIVHPNGDVVPVPDGAVGPLPVDNGEGFQFTGGSGGHGLDRRTTDVRIMDPVTTGKYRYPDGYVSYSNGSGQAVNPYTGQTLGKADPWWHWPF